MSRRKRKPVGHDPKPAGPDLVDLIRLFEYCAGEVELVDDDGMRWVRIPKVIADNVLALLKTMTRPCRGRPPKKNFHQRLIDFAVTNNAQDRLEALSARGELREDALDQASEWAAARDPRPKGVALTPKTIRWRLEHPAESYRYLHRRV